jgi:thymidylate synthase
MTIYNIYCLKHTNKHLNELDKIIDTLKMVIIKLRVIIKFWIFNDFSR